MRSLRIQIGKSLLEEAMESEMETEDEVVEDVEDNTSLNTGVQAYRFFLTLLLRLDGRFCGDGSCKGLPKSLFAQAS